MSPLLIICRVPAAIANPEVRFIVIGDTPYSPAETERFHHQIGPAIAQTNPPFVVHYGDFKAGGEACTLELFEARRDQILNLLPGRVFYTPGDNDWTDCDRPFLTPPLSELAQLDLVRRLFFAQPLDIPQDWAVVRQPLFPENARWVQNEVVFATVHVVSTNNGRQEILLDDIEAALSLVEARDQANRVWLEGLFHEANKRKAKAVVVVVQADVTAPGGRGVCTAFHRINCDAFATFREALRRHASQFQEKGNPLKPVLLIHGDTNPYCWDRGFGGDMAPNLWRLNAWGDFLEPADATEVIVETAQMDQPFRARTLLGDQEPMKDCPI